MPGQLISDGEFVALQDLAEQALSGACQVQRSTETTTASGGQSKTWANHGDPIAYALTLPGTPTERALAQQVAPQVMKVILLPSGTNARQETDRLLLDTEEIYHIIGSDGTLTYEVLRRVSVVLAPLQGASS